jgi:hypothetical protein
MRKVTLAKARAAKRRLSRIVNPLAELRGIGIVILANGYGVKVNLSRKTAAEIPADIDGVPVIIELVGNVRS